MSTSFIRNRIAENEREIDARSHLAAIAEQHGFTNDVIKQTNEISRLRAENRRLYDELDAQKRVDSSMPSWVRQRIRSMV